MFRSTTGHLGGAVRRVALAAVLCLAAGAVGTALPAQAEGTFTLTTVVAGNGLGSIVSEPAGIDCGADCEYDFDADTVVLLVALPDIGSTFTGWSGGECSGIGDCEVTMSAAVTVEATFSVPDTFIALDKPMRLVDTRRGSRGALEAIDEATPLAARSTRRYSIAGVGGVPADATVALNVTAVSPAANGHLTIYPCESAFDAAPSTSFLNYQRLVTVANAGLVTLSASGGVCVSSLAQSHVILDLTGWLPTGKTHVGLDSPVRLFDTRAGSLGALETEDDATPFTAGTVKMYSVGGNAGLPASGFNAIVVNAVAVTPSTAGELLVYPCDNLSAVAPASSVVRYVPGVTAAAGTIVGVKSGTENFCVRSTGTAHVLVDVSGYVKIGGGSGYASWGGAAPKRLVDTRVDQRGILEANADVSTPLVGGTVTRFQLAGIAGIPAAGRIRAIAATLGVVAPTVVGHVQAWACDDTSVPAPMTSVINFRTGRPVSNELFLPVSRNGGVCLMATSTVDITLDATGWFK